MSLPRPPRAARRPGPGPGRRASTSPGPPSRPCWCSSAARCCSSPCLAAHAGAPGARASTRCSPSSTAGVAIGAAVPLWQRVQDPDRGPFSTLAQAVGVDGFSVFATITICCAVVLAALLLDGWLRREEMEGAEPYVLLLLSASGGVMMASANDLIVMFLGLEILSIAVYVLAAMHLRKITSQEAGVKYFVLGAFSSAFFLYGIALVYGGTGSTNLVEISDVLLHHRAGRQRPGAGRARPPARRASAFKVAAVPFHFWTPDVYQGAPSPSVAWMASGVKVAGFAGLLRVFYLGLRHLPASTGSRSSTCSPPSPWSSGRVLAIVQTDVKRMLAYSSINHAGFILVAVQAASELGVAGGRSSTWPPTRSWWPAASGSSRSSAARATSATASTTTGACRRDRPVLALAFALFLFAQAGVPLTSGLLRQVLRDRRPPSRRGPPGSPSSPCSPPSSRRSSTCGSSCRCTCRSRTPASPRTDPGAVRRRAGPRRRRSLVTLGVGHLPGPAVRASPRTPPRSSSSSPPAEPADPTAPPPAPQDRWRSGPRTVVRQRRVVGDARDRARGALKDAWPRPTAPSRARARRRWRPSSVAHRGRRGLAPGRSSGRLAGARRDRLRRQRAAGAPRRRRPTTRPPPRRRPTDDHDDHGAPDHDHHAPPAAAGRRHAGSPARRATEVAALQARLDRARLLARRLRRAATASSTRQAVMAFQKAEGLGRDGVAGPTTLAALAGRRPARAPRTHRAPTSRSTSAASSSSSSRAARPGGCSTPRPATARPTPRPAAAPPWPPRPPGASRSTARSTGSARRRSARCTGRSTSSAASRSTASGSIPAEPASHGCARVTNAAMDLLWSSGLAPDRHPGAGVLMAVLTPPRGTPAVGLAGAARTCGACGPGPYDRRRRGRVPAAALRRSAARPHTLHPWPPPPPALPDVELVELARSGDRSAFDELLRRHDDRMRGLAYRLTGRPPPHGRRPPGGLPQGLPGPAPLPGRQRLRHLALPDHLQRLHRRAPQAQAVARVTTEDPVDPVSAPARARSASSAPPRPSAHALAELPVDQRVTVVLVDGEGFDHREAAEILGVAPGTVASRLHRARAALRRVLGEEVR